MTPSSFWFLLRPRRHFSPQLPGLRPHRVIQSRIAASLFEYLFAHGLEQPGQVAACLLLLLSDL